MAYRGRACRARLRGAPRKPRCPAGRASEESRCPGNCRKNGLRIAWFYDDTAAPG